jgi:hypothetical protein
VVFPTPAEPVITAPRRALIAAVSWESSLFRPTSGQIATGERTPVARPRQLQTNCGWMRERVSHSEKAESRGLQVLPAI